MGGVFSSQDSQSARSATQPARSAPQHARSAPQPVRSSPQPVRSAPAPVQISAAAISDMQDQSAKLTRLVSSLSTQGKCVFQALQATMSLAATDDIAHFESALRKTLQESMAGVQLDRIASGQWQCSYRGEQFVVSIRTEVLGASLSESFEFLSELKGQARLVKSTLLGDNAQWMRSLSKGCAQQQFLNACRCAPDERGNTDGAHHPEVDWGGATCDFCEKPESSAHMGGRHKCRVTATFRCPECRSQWSTAQARFDPEEERVLGQKCKECHQSGDLLRWNFSDTSDGGNQKTNHERKPHRSDLCEACGNFGNCQGAFFEPFIMSSAIALLMKQCATQWAKSGDILVANAGLHAVAMLPHISSGSAGQSTSTGGSSWSSKGGCKGKFNTKDWHGDRSGGCQVGHAARENSKGGRSGKGTKGYKKGQGKGKGGRA